MKQPICVQYGDNVETPNTTRHAKEPIHGIKKTHEIMNLPIHEFG